MADGREIEYSVPVIKTQKYGKEEIFEKKLYLLLPFYILRYEKMLPQMEMKEELKKQLLEEYEDILSRLEQELLPEDAETYAELHQRMQQVMDYILQHNKDIQEGVKQVMGGRVLESYREMVFKEGHMEGRTEGRLGSFVELVKDGLLDLAVAAERVGMSVESFRKLMVESK